VFILCAAALILGSPMVLFAIAIHLPLIARRYPQGTRKKGN